jgi:hypothetical protein
MSAGLLIRVGKYNNLEWEQIKRGTPGKEFLYCFFALKPFFFSERKFPHTARLAESDKLPDR